MAGPSFRKLLEHVPHKEFQKCVTRYDGDAHWRGFSCWDQYLAMAFAQLTYRESLRDIEACLVWSKIPICMKSKDDGATGPDGPDRGCNTTLHHKRNHLVTSSCRLRNQHDNVSCFQRHRVFWTIRRASRPCGIESGPSRGSLRCGC